LLLYTDFFRFQIMSVNNDEGKNNGWHLKNGKSGEEAGGAGEEEEEEEPRGMEAGDEAPLPASRKRARSSGSISNNSELSTDSHGAKRIRVSTLGFMYL
jgi:hypothetical protein